MRKLLVTCAVVAASTFTGGSQALAAGDGTFTPAPDAPFTAGSTPDALGVFDFNVDGDPDLVVPNRDSSDLTFMVGDTGPAFTVSQVGLTVSNAAPQDVAVGNFNGDTNPDFAVSNPGATPDSITIFKVTPGQITPATVNVSQNPSKFAIGDFDRDGDQDIVVTTPSNERMAILTNDGAGTFTVASTNNSVGDAATSIATGDFNADGDPDLVVTNSLLASATILLGADGATFTRQPTSLPVGTSPSDVAVGDFNGDGDPDLAVTGAGSDDVTILTGQLGPGFAAAGTISVGDNPSSVIAADLNGDGDPDLAVTNQGAPGSEAGTVSLLLGGSGATFTPASGSPLAVGAEPLSVTTADFNADGAADLATANGASDNISVLLGNVAPGGGGGGDTKAPETSIDNGPTGKTNKHKAKIRYSANEASTFECKLTGKGVDSDLANFSACGDAKIKYKHLQAGKKKFFVRATDAAGNVDKTPAKLKWKVLNG
jgi:hypothetical protein